MILPRSAPCDEGVDATGLVAFLDAVERRGIELHSLMVARHGRVVAEGWWTPYAADRAHLVYSVSKSLTSTAVGFLVHEGALTLDDLVLPRLGEVPAERLHPGWSRVTLRHCLTMTVGHDTDAWEPAFAGAEADVFRPGTDWLPLVLATAPEHEPGTTFTYNQVATYLVSRLVHAVTGQGLVEILRRRLLEPLGITELAWQRDPLGHELGFTGAHLTTEALLAFTQFCLHGGAWGERQLLPREWFAEASRPFGPPNRDPAGNADSVLGYGYSFWTSRHGFRADGAFGQLGLVLPEQDAVVAITAEHAPMQEILDEFWPTAFPALGRAGSAAADALLAERLADLALPPPSRAARSGVLPGPEAASFVRAEGHGDRSLPGAYSGVTVRRDRAGHLLGLQRNGLPLELAVGQGDWLESVLEVESRRLPVVARGGWQDGDRFQADVLVIESPHRFRVEGRRSSGEVTLTWRACPLTGPDPLDLAVRTMPQHAR
ncbi:serine hydrolase domain-containing protein [Intrasporangium sp.]|uniref:serine hydrolase domain-containing protein n=1 Tax=Intrasporangium sp. TaxID=1925024 RepID=UPI00293A5914|nr:serine hydrolase domain-containing protein [Intrasporangium sp.]MDV3222001.1 beta-lactamase family protein [Intrasporangium sp.]